MGKNTSEDQKQYMKAARHEAASAAALGEVPVGAVLVDPKGAIIASAHNLCEANKDPTAHAEMIVIQKAAKILKSTRLEDCDLYVTLEPCAMCAGAISFARIRRLYFGAYDVKSGAVDHGARFFTQPTCHHAPEAYGGIDEKECAALLKTFFEGRR